MIVTLRGRRFRGGGGEPPANTLPVVSLVLPVGNQFVAGDLLVRASVSDTDNNIASVKFYLDGVEKYDVPSPNAAGGNFDYTIPLADIPVGGPYEIRVRATDGGGVWDEDTKTFSIVESSGLVNVALASNGAVASASSKHPDAFTIGCLNDGDRLGVTFPSGNWVDGTQNVFPDFVVISFGAAQPITEIDVFSPQTDRDNPVEPTPILESTFAMQAFSVQYWDGGAWVTIDSVTGNTLVWRHFEFAEIVTDAIRVSMTAGPFNHSTLVEVEAWSPNPNIPPPSVQITAPPGSSVFGVPTIEATVTSSLGGVINRVTLHRNGDLIDTVTGLSTTSYNYEFTDTVAPEGQNDYLVSAFDDVHVLEGDAQKSVTRLGGTGDVPMFWNQRSTLPWVTRARSLDAEDEAEFNAGRWPWQNVGLWTPSPGSGPNGFFVTDTGSNPGRELPLPVFDTTNPPPGRTKSLKTTIIEGSPANAGGGAFINSRGGNMYPDPVNNPNYLANTPNFDDLDIRIHGNALIGTKIAVQCCFRGDEAYCTTSIYEQVGGSIEPTANHVQGWKILDITRPNYGSGANGENSGTSFDSTITDDGSVVLTGGSGGKRYPVVYNSQDIKVTVGRSHPDYPSLADENQQPRDPDAGTIFPYASYLEAMNNPGMETPELRAIPEGAIGGIKTTWGAGQLVAELLSIDAPMPDGLAFICTFRFKWYWQDWGGDEALVGDHPWQTTVGPHLFSKLNIFVGYLTEKARGQSHPDMNCWSSMAILATDKIPPVAEIKYMTNWRPSWRRDRQLQTWHMLGPKTVMENYTAPNNATYGLPDFNSTAYEPWNVHGMLPWSRAFDAWGGLQWDDDAGDAYVSIRTGHTASAGGIYWQQANSVARIRFSTDDPVFTYLKASSPYGLPPPDPFTYEYLDGGELNPPVTGLPNHYSDGGPPGAHTFNCGVAIHFPTGPKLCFPSLGAIGHYSNLQDIHCVFDVTSATWDVTTYPPLANTNPYQAHKVYPGTRRCYILSKGTRPHRLSYFDYDNPGAGEVFIIGTDAPGSDTPGAVILDNYTGDCDLTLDEDRDRAVCWTVREHPGHVGEIVVVEGLKDGNCETRFQALNGPGAAYFVGRDLTSAHYLKPINKYFIMEADTNDCLLIDPETWYTEYMGVPPVAIGDANISRNPEKLLMNSNNLGCLIFFPAFYQPVYFWPYIS
jgi:hypothetical protein